MAASDRLNQDELAAVLRRAAELDVDRAEPDDGLTVAALEAAAAEVGLAPEAVRQAVAELRAGVLPVDPGAPELTGDDIVVVARTVPLGVDDAIAMADAFLGRKVFERVRDRGAARTYRRREDVVAKVTAAVDLGGGAKKLKSVAEVQVSAVAVEGGTLLRFVVRLNRALALAPKAVGFGIGVTSAALSAAAFATTLDPLFGAVGLPIGGAAGVGSYRVGRAVLWRERRVVAETVDGFLDDLELGRRPDPGPVDRIKRLAPRLKGPWA